MTDCTWLNNLTQETFASCHFPLRKVLENSVFYPASGTDGSPVRHWWVDACSFVYVDLGLSERTYIKEFEASPFKGYRVWARRLVDLEDMSVQMNKFLPPTSLDPTAYKNTLDRSQIAPSSAFAIWTVLERLDNAGDQLGPQRFSMLHLRAEGVATYQGLYVRNQVLPIAICIIRPGTAFGGNFSNFEEVLFEVMASHPNGMPAYLMAWHEQGSSELFQPWSETYSTPPLQTGNKDGEMHFKLSLYRSTKTKGLPPAETTGTATRRRAGNTGATVVD